MNHRTGSREHIRTFRFGTELPNLHLIMCWMNSEDLAKIYGEEMSRTNPDVDIYSGPAPTAFSRSLTRILEKWWTLCITVLQCCDVCNKYQVCWCADETETEKQNPQTFRMFAEYLWSDVNWVKLPSCKWCDCSSGQILICSNTSWNWGAMTASASWSFRVAPIQAQRLKMGQSKLVKFAHWGKFVKYYHN